MDGCCLVAKLGCHACLIFRDRMLPFLWYISLVFLLPSSGMRACLPLSASLPAFVTFLWCPFHRVTPLSLPLGIAHRFFVSFSACFQRMASCVLRASTRPFVYSLMFSRGPPIMFIRRDDVEEPTMYVRASSALMTPPPILMPRRRLRRTRANLC